MVQETEIFYNQFINQFTDHDPDAIRGRGSRDMLEGESAVAHTVKSRTCDMQSR